MEWSRLENHWRSSNPSRVTSRGHYSESCPETAPGQSQMLMENVNAPSIFTGKTPKVMLPLPRSLFSKANACTCLTWSMSSSKDPRDPKEFLKSPPKGGTAGGAAWIPQGHENPWKGSPGRGGWGIWVSLWWENNSQKRAATTSCLWKNVKTWLSKTSHCSPSPADSAVQSSEAVSKRGIHLDFGGWSQVSQKLLRAEGSLGAADLGPEHLDYLQIPCLLRQRKLCQLAQWGSGGILVGAQNSWWSFLTPELCHHIHSEPLHRAKSPLLRRK